MPVRQCVMDPSGTARAEARSLAPTLGCTNQSQENHTRRAPHGCVISGEGQRAVWFPKFVKAIVIATSISTSTRNPERRSVVGALIPRNDEPAGGIDDDDSWIIPERLHMTYLSKFAVPIDPENADRVARAVYPVDESAVVGDADFRRETGAHKSWRQARDLLLLG